MNENINIQSRLINNFFQRKILLKKSTKHTQNYKYLHNIHDPSPHRIQTLNGNQV